MRRRVIGRLGWLLLTRLLNYGCAGCRGEAAEAAVASFRNETGSDENNGPRVFSPRMDYDEWTPLGRGDPLKNDPTFDYVPPILDRVRYWMDSRTTEASSESEILVLGVTAKKTSAEQPEQFLKFFNGPKFMMNQRVAQGSYANDFTGSRGAEPPKIIRKTNFRNGIQEYGHRDGTGSIPATHRSTYFYNENSKPETMMPPPPVARNPDANRPPHRIYDVPTKNHPHSDKHRYSARTEAAPPLLRSKHRIYDNPQNSYLNKPPRNYQIQSRAPSLELPVTQNKHESATASVSSEKSNLIYQSSQTISGEWLAKTRQPTLENEDSVAWKTGVSFDDHRHLYEEDVRRAAGSAHHRAVSGPNADTIAEGDGGTEEETAMDRKEVAPPSELASNETMEEKKNMYIVLAKGSWETPSETTIDRSKKESAVTVVTPEKSIERNLSGTSARDDEPPETTSASSEDTRVTAETEMPAENATPRHSFGNFLTHPKGAIRANDSPARVHSPTRIVTPYRQTPTRHASHGELGESRPAQIIARYDPRLDPPPLPSLRLARPVGHVKHDTKFAHTEPFETMTNAKHRNQLDRFYQHRFAQSLPTAITAPSTVPRPVSSFPINGIRDLILKDEAHHYSQRMPEIIETTTVSVPSRILSDIGISSNVNGAKDDIESQLDMKIKDEDTGNKIVSTTESIIAPTPPPTTARTVPTTTAPTLTTDPIFAHYDQPANPMSGPMYLIIQGHSKVKTYKPWVEKHGNETERNENFENTTNKEISEFEKFVKENAKRIASAERLEERKKTTERSKEQPIGRDGPLSFVDSGLGAFPVPPSSRGDLCDKS